ncbi:MAG: hypothetical protein ROO73_01195 [Roseivirga sp.]
MQQTLLTAKILEHQPKIGPFFFQEFIIVFLASFFLFFTVLFVSLFINISPLFLLLVPAAFLALLALARFLAAPFIRSPWYLHKLIAYQLLAPKKLEAAPFKPIKP